ncbi:MAG: radical SAM protein [Candidatus Fermentibacteria bacterium]
MIIPPLKHLYVNPSGECNLGCLHCWIAPERSATPFKTRKRSEMEFTPEEFSGLLEQAVELGLINLKFTGGEPLLRSDFTQLYRISAEHTQKLTVDIETNGTLVPDGLWDLFEEYPPGSVSVSLDSVSSGEHDDFRNTPGAWKRSVAFIGELVKRGISTQIIMSTAAFEVQPVLEMASFCRNEGVSSLKINPVQPVGRGESLLDHRGGIHTILSFADELLRSCGMSVILDLPPALLPLNRIKYSGRCPIHNLLGVLPDGGISFCGIGFSCGELVMGNFLKDNIEDIWNNSELLAKLRVQVPAEFEGICGNCIHKNRCLGNCVMQNFYSNSNFTSAYWMCREADRAGVFPQTRKIQPDA